MATASPPKLKIGLVLDDGLDKPDGVQQYILAVGEWLQSKGHEVRYLVGETSRQDITGVHSLSRNIHVNSNGNSMTIPLPTSRRKLRQFLSAESFDVLHVQTPYSPFMGGQLITLADTRTAVIGTFHIMPDSLFIKWGNWLLGVWCYRSLRRIDKMLSVSTAAQQFAKSSFGVTSEVLPNVIDFKRFNSAKPLAHYQDDRLTILFLGRLVPRKGCQLLLEAINILLAETGSEMRPQFRVVICGKGPVEAKLKRYVTRHNMSDIVEFAGFVSEEAKPAYYASADVSVFPSRGGESFGIVLVEAMASGRAAVLAGNNPGYRSVMEPMPELLFNPSSSRDLAKKLQKYIADEAVRKDSAKWGESYSANFDVNIVGRQLLKTYNNALRKRRET